jgi:hypothetical protein
MFARNQEERSMTTSPLRSALAFLCAASLMVVGIPIPALSQTAEIVGSIAGKVFDSDSRTPLSNVAVRAHAITTNKRLAGATTDERGSFFVPHAPAGVYTFTLVHQGVEYPVTQRLDARAGMTFLLETCFRLDKAAKTASVIAGDCSSELLAQAQVVTIGPHRFLRPQSTGEPLSLFPDKPDAKKLATEEEEDGTEATESETESEEEPEAEPETEPQLEPVEEAEPVDVNEPDPSEPDFTVPDAVESSASGPIIEHSELECLNHDEFPQVDSVIRPGDQVEVSRVYFRSDKYPDFYYVEAAGLETPDEFRAVLPKPSAETERIIYYVEAVDTTFNTAQTEEHDPEVTDDSCRRDPAGYYEGTPEIVVGATTAGATAVPPGFQALGITGFISAAGVTTAAAAAAAGGAAAGAGLSTGLVLVVTGAAVATGGTVVVTTTNNDEASPPE